MRSQGQVRHKMKQVLFRHLQKKLRAAFRHRPDTCIHNQEVSGEGLQVFVCGCPENTRVLCDARVQASLDQALSCPWWKPVKGKDALKADFQALIQSSDRGLIATEYPDVAALLWFLDEDITDAFLGDAGEPNCSCEGEERHE